MTYAKALSFGIQAITVLALIMPPVIAVKASKINVTGGSAGMRIGKALIFVVTLAFVIGAEIFIAPGVKEFLTDFLKSMYHVI